MEKMWRKRSQVLLVTHAAKQYMQAQLYKGSDLLVEYLVYCIFMIKVSPLKTHTTHCQMTCLDIQPSQQHHKHSNGVENAWKIKSHADLIPISTMEYE